ncbi:MAG: hypothetical protein NT077_02905 [Candidatus Taylorbacteria bacterium]|nr:hypothetical protein [Candidatus Taylorbacteria bacterium]
MSLWRDLWQELNMAGKSLALGVVLVAVFAIGFVAFQFVPSTRIGYLDETASAPDSLAGKSPLKSSEPIVVTHINTPLAVKAVYMTACTASVPRLRENLIKTMTGTEINSLVVDIKDYTGTLAYSFPNVRAPKGPGCRINDLPQFIDELHKKGIYAIARVTVFQDPVYAIYKPDMAVQSILKPGQPWKDRNGLAYIDPNFTEYWKYVVSIAKDAHDAGFDEINFDYIRFPSDGDIGDAQFATPIGVKKSEVIRNFFVFLHAELKPLNIVTSADLFGQTTISRDDMGIGQILEDALPYFDFVAPMNYPSHYANGFMGYPNPALKPYEVVRDTMVTAVLRTVNASSSIEKLRPWLQAFDMGATYTPSMVRAEIQGVQDAGLNSWMLWDAANRYDRNSFYPMTTLPNP